MTRYIYWHRIRDTLNSKKGQGLVEYVFILGFVALIVILSLTSFGQSIFQKFGEIQAILME